MVIKFNKVKEKLVTGPLNVTELSIIDSVERFMDKKINKSFDGTSISFNIGIVNMTNLPRGCGPLNNIQQPRRVLMSTELKKRYEDAGWSWNLYEDDGLDGPNMSGPDYWVLKGNE